MKKYMKVIDYISNLKCEWPVTMGPPDLRPELNTLITLQTGLEYLNALVQEKEASLRQCRIPLVAAYDDLEGLRIIACAFRWYSVTACDYVRTVGWLTKGGDDEQAKQYLDDVIPEVHYFRDKVGAHFSPSHPRKSDTPSSRFFAEESYTVHFDHDNNVFVASGSRWNVKASGSFETIDISWSLTRVHRELSKRYWPDSQSSYTIIP